MIMLLFVQIIKGNSLEIINATHLVTLPLYQTENAYVVFAKGEGNIFNQDSTIIIQVVPIEDTVDYKKNKNISLKEYVQNKGLSINADDYCELKYNDKAIMKIDSINANYMNADRLYVRTIHYPKLGFWNSLKKFYETKDLVLYNRKLYIKKSKKR